MWKSAFLYESFVSSLILDRLINWLCCNCRRERVVTASGCEVGRLSIVGGAEVRCLNVLFRVLKSYSLALN